MEAHLNAREFLKRFHLPQLVRLSGWNNEEQQEEDEVLEKNSSKSCVEKGFNSNTITKSTHCKPITTVPDDTSISSSFIALNNCQESFDNNVDNKKQQQHEKSDWTYRRGKNNNFLIASKSQLELSAKITDGYEQKDYYGESRSLAISNERDNHWTDQDEPFKSMPAWTPTNNINKSDRMLNLIQQQVIKMPRASLIGQNQQKENINNNPSVLDKKRISVEFSEKNSLVKLSLNEVNKTHCNNSSYNSIKLIPPCKNVTYSKLDLNQPFLLYKAYKKLELCAYVIDSKNEINDKSGDPIYFPQNYTGKYSL